MKVVATEVAPRAPVPLPVMNVDRVPWQRLSLSILGIAIIMTEWRWATNHLYSLPPTSIAAFTTITVNSLYVVGALVVFFVTGRLVYEWKSTTTNELVSRIDQVYEHVPAPKHFDDPKIP